MTVYYRSMRARSLVLFIHITMLAFLLVINRLSSGVTDEIKKTLSIQMMLLTCLNPLFFFFHNRLPSAAFHSGQVLHMCVYNHVYRFVNHSSWNFFLFYESPIIKGLIFCRQSRQLDQSSIFV